MKELDERGWVFVASDCVYRCCMWGGRPWLFRWRDGEKCWETVRALTQMDIWQLPHNLTDEQQELYFQFENELITKLKPKISP